MPKIKFALPVLGHSDFIVDKVHLLSSLFAHYPALFWAFHQQTVKFHVLMSYQPKYRTICVNCVVSFPG